MAFDTLEEVISSGKAGRPASIALTIPGTLKTKGSGLPLCRIFISNVICNQIAGGVTSRDRFNLLIGTGDDKGVIRLNKTEGGLLSPFVRKSGAMISCGYVQQLGKSAQRREYCTAELIDEDTVEIVLPSWAAQL